jgi:DNA-directed RNA polymerase subunit RPC12/RpoP
MNANTEYSCVVCGGPLYHLGQLSPSMLACRCRDCGMDTFVPVQNDVSLAEYRTKVKDS